MAMRIHRILFIAALAFHLNFAPYAAAEPVKAVSTIFPLGDILKRVGGELVDVQILLKPGQSPHTYEPSTADMKWMESADVVVMAGFGLESWLDKLLKASSKKGRALIDVSTTVKNPISSRHDEGDGDHGHAHGSINPHYWLDPEIMANAALYIGERLASMAPDESKAILNRASVVAAELRELDLDIHKRLSNPGLAREVVTFHNAWPYFARRYGIKIVGVIETEPGREPSAKHMAKLVREIKKTKARAVMMEPQFSQRLGQTLAREAGVEVALVDPEGGVSGRQSYFEMMRYNVSQFEKVLNAK